LKIKFFKFPTYLLQEICAVSKISKKEIGRCFKLILKALETSVDIITTGDFMSRFCSNLGLTNVVQRAATHIARKAVELDIVPGRSPISVAAAAIYMASQVRDHQGSTLISVVNKFQPNLPHTWLNFGILRKLPVENLASKLVSYLKPVRTECKSRFKIVEIPRKFVIKSCRSV